MPTTKPNIALIGCGYWGSNFLRIMLNSPLVNLKTVCDADNERIGNIQNLYPAIKCTGNYYDIVNDPTIDAAVVCTPVNTHFDISLALLQNGKHVLCEKPLTPSAALCESLKQEADTQKRILLTGHVFEYHHAVKHMKNLIAGQAIGKVQYLQFTRMGLGPTRSDVNVIFDLAAHDVGMAQTLVGQMPLAVTANGSGINRNGLEEVAFIQLEFPDKVFAVINVSWIDPIKQRLVKVVGTKKMMVFDDVSATEKLKIIDTGTGYQLPGGDYGSFQMAVKDGDIVIPNLPVSEPLADEFNHFLNCIKGEAAPLTNATYAANVVRVMEAANQSLLQNGKKVLLP